MRLVSYLVDTARLGAVLADGSVLDLAGYWATAGAGGAPPANAAELLRAGEDGLAAARRVVEAAERDLAAHGAVGDPAGPSLTHDPDGLVWLPPVTPGRIFAVGLNYRSHAEEQGAKIPASPVVFTKSVGALTGHRTAIVHPAATEALDYEAELAVVIGSRCADVPVEQAMGHVAGYTCLNDVTARDLQRRDRQWFRSKSYPTFAPLGRDLVTVDSAPGPDEMVVTCHVDGEQRQSAPVSDLIFGVPELVSFISSFTTLEVGDVIATGTPSGVGFVHDPPRFLHVGDTVTVGVQGLTSLTNEVVAPLAE